MAFEGRAESIRGLQLAECQFAECQRAHAVGMCENGKASGRRPVAQAGGAGGRACACVHLAATCKHAVGMGDTGTHSHTHTHKNTHTKHTYAHTNHTYAHTHRKVARPRPEERNQERYRQAMPPGKLP